MVGDARQPHRAIHVRVVRGHPIRHHGRDPVPSRREQLDASPWVSSSQQATAELPGASLRVEGSVINGAIGDAAREVTVDDRTPYEAALSLQSWLRGPGLRVLAGDAGRGGLRRQRRRSHRTVPHHPRGVLRALRVDVRAHGALRRDPDARSDRLSARHDHERADRRPAGLFGHRRSPARVARGVPRRRRLDAVRADPEHRAGPERGGVRGSLGHGRR